MGYAGTVTSSSLQTVHTAGSDEELTANRNAMATAKDKTKLGFRKGLILSNKCLPQSSKFEVSRYNY